MEESIGKSLKQIRESKGISLEEISQKTRIRLAYLQAIEADDFEALPSKIQTRGFLRLYTHELGVELDSLKVKGYHLVEDRKEKPETIVDPTPQIEDEADSQPQISEQKAEDDQPDARLGTAKTLVKDDFPSIPQFQTASATPNADEIFEEIGRQLHHRRAMISLSLDDVFDNIHVRPPYLEALEAGRFDELPSPVQAKGMLTNYAEFLNLDVDALLLRFADGLQLQRLEKQKALADNKTSSKEISSARLRLKNFFSMDLLVMVGLFIGFAAFIIWGLNRILAVDTPNMVSTDIPEVADVLLATSTATAEATLGEDETAIPPEATPTGELANTPIFTPAVSNFPINIVIIPRQQAWVQINSDYSLVYEGRLLPGNAYDYSGDEIVEILTGNAGALQIYFNDQDIGSAGLIGEVETLTFTESGLVRPTPTITPTPTQTLQSTPSPTGSTGVETTRTPTNDETN